MEKMLLNGECVLLNFLVVILFVVFLSFLIQLSLKENCSPACLFLNHWKSADGSQQGIFLRVLILIDHSGDM